MAVDTAIVEMGERRRVHYNGPGALTDDEFIGQLEAYQAQPRTLTAVVPNSAAFTPAPDGK